MNVVIVTGMSGAGKTTALQALEDAGFLAVDNVPPALWSDLATRVRAAHFASLAIAIDVRGLAFLEEAPAALEELVEGGFQPKLVYLDAPTDTLVQRYNFTRRIHALQRGSLRADLDVEREALRSLRSLADLVIDTSRMSQKDLRRRMQGLSGDERFGLRITSFGYKRGLPTDVDTVLDVRGLKNPYYEADLVALPGTDARVQAYVFAGSGLDAYARLRELARELASAAKSSGRGGYEVAIGCTGGQHRSVAVAERMFLDLSGSFDVSVQHRDLGAALAEHGDGEGRDEATHARDQTEPDAPA